MIRSVPIMRRVSRRLGTVLPCCPADMSTISALLSNTCSWCSTADSAAQQALSTNPNNADNTSGVPCCDPSDGILSQIFSNTCNACNPIGDTLGLSNVPTWAWVAGAGTLAFLLLRK